MYSSAAVTGDKLDPAVPVILLVCRVCRVEQ